MAKKATAARPEKSLLEIVDCEQRSEEWYAARRGLITASNFGVLMGETDTLGRQRLLYRVAGERVSGELAEEGFHSRAMDRGIAMEPEIRDAYAARHNSDLQQVGFGRNFSGLRLCGASPDSLVGFDGALEIKTTMPELLIPMLLKGAGGWTEHRAQVQGVMHVFERGWCDLVIGYRGMPPFEVTVHRDDVYIKRLDEEIQRFNYDVGQLVDRLQKMGLR